MRQELYVYSLDGEHYQGQDETRGWETRDQALAAGRSRARTIADLKQEQAGPVWTAVQVHYPSSAFYPDAESLVDLMVERATADVGADAVDDWLCQIASDATREGADEGSATQDLRDFVEKILHPFLDAWVQAHGFQPTFWSVSDVAKHADDDTGIVAR